MRLSGESSYVVARSVLIEHHARNERVQESAMGLVDSLETAHRLLGEIDGGAVWASQKNARTFLTATYFTWLLLHKQRLIREDRKERGGDIFPQATPAALRDRDLLEAEYQRTYTAAELLFFRKYAEEHFRRCLLLDEDNKYITDGIHGLHSPACRFDDLRYRVLDGLDARVPYGCETDRLQLTDSCRKCLPFLARRTAPPGEELDLDAVIFPDYARADAYARSRAVAEAREIAAGMTAGAAASTDGDGDDLLFGGGSTGAAAEETRRKQAGSRKGTVSKQNAKRRKSSSELEETGAHLTKAARTSKDRVDTIEKLQASRTFRETVAAVTSAQERARQNERLSDTEKFHAVYGGRLHPAEYLDPKHSAFCGFEKDVSRLSRIVEKVTSDTGTQYRC